MIAHLPLKGRVRGTPLRIKLVAAVLALVAAALLVISVTTAYFLHNYLIGQIDGELRGTVNNVEQFARDADSLPVQVRFPTDYLIVASSALNSDQLQPPQYDTTRFSPNDLPALPATANDIRKLVGATGADGQRKMVGDPHTVRAADSAVRWRVLYVQLSTGQVALVGEQLVDVDLAVNRLLWIDVLVGGVVLILLASLGAAAVQTSLRPLVDIERTAAAIAGGDLTQRVPDPEPGEPEPKSELGRLSRALNAMLSQIEAAFTARAASETAARYAESAARDAAVAAQASEARARRSEERMRQFVADASHELRTPLTTIRGFAELYRQGAAAAPEDTARLVRRIEDEAARMGLLVEDLLLLARLDRERPLTLAPVELPVLAAEAVQAAQAVAPDRDIALEIAPGSGELVVLADDGRLRQVIGNLVTNALTHTPPEATVRLRLSAETGNLAVIDVVDTGLGLSGEQAERVFERFYRADAARTRRAGGSTGTGLGLAIVAALVAAHHGTVEVTQTPGGGATFRVRLPLLPDESAGAGVHS